MNVKLPNLPRWQMRFQGAVESRDQERTDLWELCLKGYIQLRREQVSSVGRLLRTVVDGLIAQSAL